MKSPLNSIKAIGFDLFNTLMTVHPQAMKEAHQKLFSALLQQGIEVQAVSFTQAYVEAAKRFLQEAHREGRETHNRFWIAEALKSQGYELSPDDPRIAETVETYFSAFYPHCSLIPGTKEILGELVESYPLALLSNFTHPPAVKKILDLLELPPFFRTVLISGALGYRKPHPYVFEQLLDHLGFEAEEVLFVGDDPDADVEGARRAGLQPVLTTCVKAENIPSAETPLSPSHDNCPPEVPRISTWNDLRSLLKE